MEKYVSNCGGIKLIKPEPMLPENKPDCGGEKPIKIKREDPNGTEIHRSKKRRK